MENALEQTCISEDSKIGEGRYRGIYVCGDYAVKVLKDRIQKKYGPIKINIPTKQHTERFGVPDFNFFEYENYLKIARKIPKNMEEHFYKIYFVKEDSNKSYLFSELIKDDDGKLSKSMEQYGTIEDLSFWEKMKGLEETLISKKIPLLDIRGRNILAKKQGNKITPVIIDYKRLGNQTYPGQFWMIFEKQMRNKQKRRFQRLREKHS